MIMNLDLFPRNSELKKVPLLYIENDKELSDLDRDNLEIILGGMGEIADLEDYNIKYLYDNYTNPNLLKEITG